MNILQPTIIKIGNRRYRKNPFTLHSDDSESIEPYVEETDDMYKENQAHDEYQDETCYLDKNKSCKLSKNQNQEEDYTDIDFINGYYKYEMRVADSYYGYIIGRNGEKKSSLERDTQTQIKIPRRGQKEDFIVIEGNDRKSVASCRNRIQLLIITARHQKPFTHLITFPLKFDQLKQKFKQFEDVVMKNCATDRGLHETIFQLPNKLHLTVCTVTLLSDHEVDQACNLLNECKKSFIKDFLIKNSTGIRVRIKGLEYMNDDPSQVDVLYAKIEAVEQDSTNLIQSISDKLMIKFVDSGLSKKQFDRVKIHATVMNTLRRQDQSIENEYDLAKTASNKQQQRESFDARNILNKFGDFDFGTYTLNEIHLSLRYSAAADGYYECISKISF